MKTIRQIFNATIQDPYLCEGCIYLQETKDAYATGDSPSDFSCLADNPYDCKRAREDYRIYLEEIANGEET